ncbi:glycosyltransferase [Streptomyces sp. NPDC012794]|uniref:glycosyltransferase n=1 Tax=Streptomyces sp. NPDC012794 TaxID=3364850 RepID=UPI00368701AC
MELPGTPLDWIEPIVGAERTETVRDTLRGVCELLDGRTVWHISDNPVRGGVAELLRANLPCLAGEGISTRWAIIGGPPEFRAFTKSLYYRLCGVAPGAKAADLERGRRMYERICAETAARLVPAMGRRSIVVLHDHQTAGLIPHLREAGCTVLWRVHVGTALREDLAAPGWEFLYRYISSAHCHITSYPGVLPAGPPAVDRRVVQPSIDPLSPKNIPLRPDADPSRLLAGAGLIEEAGGAPRGRHALTDLLVRHPARVVRAGGPAPAGAPLVTQVSRWDRVKDVPGVIRGFAEYVDPAFGAHLMLVGPDTRGDRQAEQVFAECRQAWEDLGPRGRRVHLVQVPTDNRSEHALTVNAVQRHSAVVIQKSLAEGFGLTVSEAAWKGRPVVAAPVGGIREQVEHGTTGLLLSDPRDLRGLGEAVNRLLSDRDYARELGRNGHQRVLRRFLTDSSVLGFARVLADAAQRYQ